MTKVLLISEIVFSGHFSGQAVKVGFNLINVKTYVTPQVVIYFGKGDLILKTPLRRLRTKGDFPNGTLHTGFIMLDKAERAEFTKL